jgi:isopentenyldiphosphate isomerase
VLNNGTYLDNEIHEIFLVRRDIDLRELRLQPEEVDDAVLVSAEELDDYELVPHGAEYPLLLRHV